MRTLQTTMIGIIVALMALCGALFAHNLVWPGAEIGCLFKIESSANEMLTGPQQLDRNWKTFKLSKPLQIVPHLQTLTINANPSTHKLREGGGGIQQLALAQFQPLKGDPPIYFDVAVITESGHTVRLLQTISGYRFLGEHTLPKLGFNLYHPDWKKMIFPKDLKIISFRVRASQPIEINSIEWMTTGFHRDPCRTWDQIEEHGIYTPGEPQPELGWPEFPDSEPPAQPH